MAEAHSSSSSSPSSHIVLLRTNEHRRVWFTNQKCTLDRPDTLQAKDNRVCDMKFKLFCSDQFKKDCNMMEPSPYTYLYIPLCILVNGSVLLWTWSKLLAEHTKKSLTLTRWAIWDLILCLKTKIIIFCWKSQNLFIHLECNDLKVITLLCWKILRTYL